MPQLFKIQRPVFTNVEQVGSRTMCLIYNEDRSIMDELPLRIEVVEHIFSEGSYKEYFEGKITPQRAIEVTRVLGNLEWPSW